MPQIRGIKTSAIHQPKESGQIDKVGVDVITHVEKIPKTKFPELLRRPGTVHPRFSGMSVARVTWQMTDAGQFYEVTYIYEGYTITFPEEPVYGLAGTLSEELIQLHPNFVTTLAGKPSAPLNGAIWEDAETGKPTTNNTRGVFREFGFLLPDETRNKMAGIESWLSPGLTWTKTYFSRTRPTDIFDIGKIDTPEGPCPNVSPRNWLLLDVTYRQRGTIYEITKSWLMSARGGWDDNIYSFT